jgi:hypothetical protein
VQKQEKNWYNRADNFKMKDIWQSMWIAPQRVMDCAQHLNCVQQEQRCTTYKSNTPQMLISGSEEVYLTTYSNNLDAL